MPTITCEAVSANLPLDEKRTDLSDQALDRRREPRFAIGARAVLKNRKDKSRTCPAVTLNISAGGLLLQLNEPCLFEVGDDVECEIALTDDPEQAFASWGIGRVIRVDRLNAAVELSSGIFGPPDETVSLP